MKYKHNIRFLTVITLFIFSCKKKWDPDEQFEKQTKAIQTEEKLHQNRIIIQAKLNLVELESKVKTSLVNRLNKQELDDLLGKVFNLLAYDQNNQRWEEGFIHGKVLLKQN